MDSDKTKLEIDDDPVRRDNPFDTATGYSGQEYHRERDAELAERNPSGDMPAPGRPQEPDVDNPPEAGKRASFDLQTGAVHGSGSGAGGGNPGEDYDDDPQGGSGYPRTGVDGETEDLGKAD